MINTDPSDRKNARPSDLVELIGLASGKFADRPFLGQKNPKGAYHWISYKEIFQRIKNFSGGLAHLGVRQDDHVGIIMKNSVEWVIAAFASYNLGAVFTPINERELPKTWEKIIHKSELKMLILPGEDTLAKLNDIINSLSYPLRVVLVEADGNNSFQHIEALGEDHEATSFFPGPEQKANLIHTSGTCGEPKGVFLTHRNILHVLYALKDHFPGLDEKQRAFSVFPWSHVAGLVDELYFAIYLGASVALMDKRETFITDIQKIKPTVIATAPILFNRLYDNIHQRIDRAGVWTKCLFEEAMRECRLFNETGKKTLKYKIFNKLILKKIRAVWGGQLKLAVVGGAAMSPSIAQFFIELGTEIYNGYGLTETTGMLTFNSPKFPNKVDSVGKPLKGMSVIIDQAQSGEECDYGEIIAYGPNVSCEYFKDPALGASSQTEDGGFRTGDLGKMDAEGYLFIIGRLKEEYKLVNGKYIHPAVIEEEIKQNFYVQQAMLYGENKRYNICLIVPRFDNLKDLATRLDIYSADHEELINQPQIQEFLDTELTNHLTHKFKAYEIPRKFLYLCETFSVENGQLTHSLKPKRTAIFKRYEDAIARLYAKAIH